jgi:hypothetical protein
VVFSAISIAPIAWFVDLFGLLQGNREGIPFSVELARFGAPAAVRTTAFRAAFAG